MADVSAFPFDPSRALPNEAFRSTALAALELDHIWHDDWVFAGTEDSVPEPGDQLALTVGAQPVLLLRQQDGTLIALSNLCAHRGTLLVEGTANGKRIQCPYHAWTFAEDGRLLSVPFAGKDEVDKATQCLPRYQVATWHGLVFVALGDNVEPFADRVAPIDQLLAERGIDELHHWPRHHESEEWACNWKLAALNAMESYHLFQVHPETLEPYSPTKESYYIRGSARATATGGTSKGEADYVLISLPPGFVGVLTPGSFIWQAAQPIAADRCVVRTGGAFSTKPPERQSGTMARWITAATNAVAVAAVPDFLPEDKAICERGQRGAAGDFEPGRLLEVERVVADFGHYLNWKLNGVEPPPGTPDGS
jgi:phenylpropionate dioxygenase-like ring-hydroxylating dioxygenase large terminal subunit